MLCTRGRVGVKLCFGIRVVILNISEGFNKVGWFFIIDVSRRSVEKDWEERERVESFGSLLYFVVGKVSFDLIMSER